MAATRSKAGRFDRSYRSLPVYWPVRWWLMWIARGDRHAGLPIGLNADTTPVLRDLVARRDAACEHERTRYVADIRAIDVRLAEIDSQLTALQRDLSARTEAAVRATEHRQVADAARNAQLEAQLRLDAALAEEAQLEARRQNRADVARSRVLRLVEYADRLAAVYRRALLRGHPQREVLVRSWDSAPAAPPEWVLTDDLTPA